MHEAQPDDWLVRGVQPATGTMFNRHNTFGCALVVNPKRLIDGTLAALRRTDGGGLHLRAGAQPWRLDTKPHGCPVAVVGREHGGGAHPERSARLGAVKFSCS